MEDANTVGNIPSIRKDFNSTVSMGLDKLATSKGSKKKGSQNLLALLALPSKEVMVTLPLSGLLISENHFLDLAGAGRKH